MAETLAVVDMLDTIGADYRNIPKGTQRVAVYITGSGAIPWTSDAIASVERNGARVILRIDQTNSVLVLPGYLVKDIEPGASKIPTAVDEALKRSEVGLRTCFYVAASDFKAAEAAVNAAGISAFVDYWVANWNFTREQAIAFMQGYPNVMAVQWASPSSNPHTLVPGSTLTLHEANIDLSVTRADWPSVGSVKPPAPKPKLPKVHPKVVASTTATALSAAVFAVLNAEGVHVDPNVKSAVIVLATLLAGYVKGAP
jgi:hypothetical protein